MSLGVVYRPPRSSKRLNRNLIFAKQIVSRICIMFNRLRSVGYMRIVRFGYKYLIFHRKKWTALIWGYQKFIVIDLLQYYLTLYHMFTSSAIFCYMISMNKCMSASDEVLSVSKTKVSLFVCEYWLEANLLSVEQEQKLFRYKFLLLLLRKWWKMVNVSFSGY